LETVNSQKTRGFLLSHPGATLPINWGRGKFVELDRDLRIIAKSQGCHQAIAIALF
jgi:hypothetical protein